ncbi:uncharacterized protein B0H18DRAFT_1180631 [Fomitopsis serialis]|uniref:uncharacterized protein n=1 Tax=Fomitopsis serialis TaxID=139415 RepID=UPI0020075D5A|nr:uncharacterized protein B0H18DRAFT_1180631 [Neoantrodia serialis]KAH9910298.1 hypothetical protein B0H18DRAFT_1180631 [Neoantrodia serialis]
MQTVTAPCDVRGLVLDFLAAHETQDDMKDYLAHPECIALDCIALGVEFEKDEASDRTLGKATAVARNLEKEEGEITDDEDDTSDASHDPPDQVGFLYHVKQNNELRLNVPTPAFTIATSGPKLHAAPNAAMLSTASSTADKPRRNRSGKGSLERLKQRRLQQQKEQKEKRRRISLQERVASTGTTVTMRSFNMKTDVNVTKTGWQGRAIPVLSREDIKARWLDGSIKEDVSKFLPLPYTGNGPQSIVKVVDVYNRLFFYRGHWRQSSPTVAFTKWHLDNKQKVDALLRDELFICLKFQKSCWYMCIDGVCAPQLQIQLKAQIMAGNLGGWHCCGNATLDPSYLAYADLKFIHTDGSVPTIHNCKAIPGDDCGRGSMVWFNMATMLQTSESGHPTLKQAAEAGATTTLDYNVEVERLFPKTS